MAVRQRMVDHGFIGIVKEIGKMKGSFTKVGLPEGGKLAESSDGEITQMSDLITVGAVHEFGAPNRLIPERSFIRSATDENREKIKKMQQIEIARITGGKSTAKESLQRMGTVMQGLIQRKIRSGEFTPLSPITIQKKGSSRPLIDTGQMLQSIQHMEVIRD